LQLIKFTYTFNDNIFFFFDNYLLNFFKKLFFPTITFSDDYTLDARQRLMLILITESIFKAVQTNKTFSIKILLVFSSAACFCVQPVAQHMQNILFQLISESFEHQILFFSVGSEQHRGIFRRSNFSCFHSLRYSNGNPKNFAWTSKKTGNFAIFWLFFQLKRDITLRSC
jgi:hypothetical protein